MATVEQVYASLSQEFVCPNCGKKGVKEVYKDWDSNIVSCDRCLFGQPVKEHLMGIAMDIVAEEEIRNGRNK